MLHQAGKHKRRLIATGGYAANFFAGFSFSLAGNQTVRLLPAAQHKHLGVGLAGVVGPLDFHASLANDVLEVCACRNFEKSPNSLSPMACMAI